MVSKAEMRSKRINMVDLPESIESSKSLVTFSSAHSVLCRVLKSQCIHNGVIEWKLGVDCFLHNLC